MKRRFISLLLTGSLLATMLVGCGGGSASTDTEQKTESSNTEQGTEQTTEWGTEQDNESKETIMKFNPHICVEKGMATDVYWQYLKGTDKSGYNSYPEIIAFLDDEKSSSGVEALDYMYREAYGIVAEYKNGKITVDSLATAISYDDVTYEIINEGDEFTYSENAKLAILHRVTLVPSTDNCKPITATVIMVVKNVDKYNAYEWVTDSLYSLDYIDKYFPDYNIE